MPSKPSVPPPLPLRAKRIIGTSALSSLRTSVGSRTLPRTFRKKVEGAIVQLRAELRVAAHGAPSRLAAEYEEFIANADVFVRTIEQLPFPTALVTALSPHLAAIKQEPGTVVDVEPEPVGFDPLRAEIARAQAAAHQIVRRLRAEAKPAALARAAELQFVRSVLSAASLPLKTQVTRQHGADGPQVRLILAVWNMVASKTGLLDKTTPEAARRAVREASKK